MGSLGDATPPLAITLMAEDPPRSCSRAARRTASGPSTSTAMPVSTSSQAQVAAGAERPRVSPWPPVWLKARPTRSSSGPATTPCSTAAAMPGSAPPASRTVVKPRRTIASSARAAWTPTSVSGMAAARAKSMVDTITWTWASMSPGSTLAPAASISRPSPVATGSSVTATIRSPSTTTVRSPTSAAVVLSKTFPLRTTSRSPAIRTHP